MTIRRWIKLFRNVKTFVMRLLWTAIAALVGGEDGTGKMAKMVIILRKDLNMRKGKMIAQGAHAAIGALENAKRRSPELVKAWEQGGCTKIVVGVNSLEEMNKIAVQAVCMCLAMYEVTDAGRTEFHGTPTITALALGPDEDERLDVLTGKLELL